MGTLRIIQIRTTCVVLTRGLRHHCFVITSFIVIIVSVTNINNKCLPHTSAVISVRLHFCVRHEDGCQWRTEGGSNYPPPRFHSFAKTETNSQLRGIYTRNNLVRIRVSFICKLSRTPHFEERKTEIMQHV
jgi:hypothetical protein